MTTSVTMEKYLKTEEAILEYSFLMWLADTKEMLVCNHIADLESLGLPERVTRSPLVWWLISSIISEFLVQVDVLQVTKLTEPVPQPLPRVSSSSVASVFKVKINQSIYLQ